VQKSAVVSKNTTCPERRFRHKFAVLDDVFSVARRNNNYYDIVRQLNLGEDRFRDFDLTNRFDHLFFFGDLNYRSEVLASVSNSIVMWVLLLFRYHRS